MDSKLGGLLPSAMALKNSLNQKPATSYEPEMPTPLQLELISDLHQQLLVGFRKGVFQKTADSQKTQFATVRNQRNYPARLNA